MADVANEDAEWLTSDEVALIVGVTAPTLRSWIHRGYGPPYYKIGPRSVRYKRGEVEAWLQAARREPKRAS